MTNKPWEPCPRCGEKQVEVEPKADKRAGNIGTLFIFAVIAFGVWKLVSGGGASAGALIVAIPVVAILTLILAPLLLVGGALVGGIASIGVKGYDAKCKVCSYQWEISEERAKELMTQTHAQ